LRLKLTLTIIITLIILSSLACSTKLVKSEFTGNITINADGSITPTNAPLLRDKNTYILNQNVLGNLTFQRKGSSVDGSNNNVYQLILDGVENVTVEKFSPI
jgi:hypothetical protein